MHHSSSNCKEPRLGQEVEVVEEEEEAHDELW
jgi:hypothetical protein